MKRYIIIPLTTLWPNKSFNRSFYNVPYILLLWCQAHTILWGKACIRLDETWEGCQTRRFQGCRRRRSRHGHHFFYMCSRSQKELWRGPQVNAPRNMYVWEGRKHRRDKTARKELIQTPFSRQIRAVKWSGIQLQRTITMSMHFHAFFIGICLDIVGKRLRVVVRQDVRMGHWQSNGLRISELMQLVVFRKLVSSAWVWTKSNFQPK